MKKRQQDLYMDIAQRTALMSRARRLKVGCVIVKDNRIISMSWNGTPTGWDNECEDTEYTFDERDTYHSSDWKFDDTQKQYFRLKTKPEVIHSESNAIAKVAKSSESAENASLFVTHSPCIDCSKLIYQSGIKEVFYRDDYHNDDGIAFLNRAGVIVTKIHDLIVEKINES